MPEQPGFLRKLPHLSLLVVCLLLASLLSSDNLPDTYARTIASTNAASLANQPAGDSPAEAQEWFYRQRAFPNATIPAGARLKALEEARLVLPASAVPHFGPPRQPGVPPQSAVWTALGPERIVGDSGVSNGNTSTSGRANAIAINPVDPNIIYIGAATGGVWKTVNGGASWTPLTDDQASLAMGALALDPQNPNTVYAGTGEANNSADSYYGAGLLKSTDGGNSWTLLGSALFGNPALSYTYFSKIIVNPRNSNDLLVATSKGVYRSLDGGANWTQSLNVYASDLVVDTTTNPVTVYAAGGNSGGAATNGIYKSTNGGTSFVPVGSGTYPSGPNAGRLALDISPTNPAILYAVISGTDGSSMGVWTTTNGGANWTQQTGNSPSFCGGQCWYDMLLRVDPSNPATVYVGGLTVWKSVNSGKDWTELGVGQYHGDMHFLTFAPGNSNKLYLADDGGIWVSSNGGAEWISLNTNLATVQFYGGSAGPNANRTPLIYGGNQDNGTLRYNGTSLDWRWVFGGDGIYTAIDPTNPNVVYLEYQEGNIFKTVDGGVNWTYVAGDITDSRPFVTPYIMDASNSSRLLVGTNSRVWETTNAAGSWQPVSPALGTVQALATAKTNGRVIYAGANYNNLWLTTNGGTGWSNLSASSAVLPFRAISSIAIDPRNAARAVVAYSGFNTGHVFLTNNTGGSWTDVSGNLPNAPVNSILFDPTNSNTFYVGTDVGFFFTTNAGQSWSSLQSGLPKAPIYQLFADPQFSTIIAATHGRGMFALSSSANPCTFDTSSLTVNSTDDNIPADPCTVTLRKALTYARINTNIYLNSLPVGTTINLTAPLPKIKQGVWLLGAINVVNGRGVPGVRVDGAGAGAEVDGFDFQSYGRIQGVAITRFSGYAINLGPGASFNAIYASYIGTADGITPLPNGGGIRLSGGASNNNIGGDATAASPSGNGNLISGNNGYGLYSTAPNNAGNILKYNWIGYASDGKTIMRNALGGLKVQGNFKVGPGNKVHN